MPAESKQLPIFAVRLTQARLEKGLTQTQLGLNAGMEPGVASPRINQYERGIHSPRPATIKRLANALGVPPLYLLCEDDLLAKLLLRWNDLSIAQKKHLLKVAAGGAKPTLPE